MTAELINQTSEVIKLNAELYQLQIYALSIAFVVAIFTLFTKDFRLKEESSKLIFVLFLFLISITLTIFQILTNNNINYFSIFIVLLIIILFTIGYRNEENFYILIIISLAILIAGYISFYYDGILSFLSYSAFGFGWLGLFYIFYISYTKIFHLREKRTLKHLWPFYQLNEWRKRIKKDEHYELNMDERKINENTFKSLPVKIKDELSKLDFLKERGYSFLLIMNEKINPINYGLMFSSDGLDNKEYINYVCVDKHPAIIFNQIKNLGNFNKDYFIFIDVFSPNYGFDDGINIDKNREINNQGYKIVTAKTVAGIHTGVNKAFKIVESNVKGTGKKTRPPCRMIWDSFSSLVDMSSKEMIKIFLSHVIPSERNYGMISVFIESENTDPEILNLLKKLVDAVIYLDYENGKVMAKVKKMNSIDIELDKGYEWENKI
ncbi:MAG: hypothetical protein OI717_00270 (plasmid) [Candidatus Methanoperedens sp.]|nr:MAG: hypothetical protein OI717_00270 [Candidatus Methanoperedens sp.]